MKRVTYIQPVAMVIYFKDITWSQTTFDGKALSTSQYFSHSSCVTHILAEFIEVLQI